MSVASVFAIVLFEFFAQVIRDFPLPANPSLLAVLQMVNVLYFNCFRLAYMSVPMPKSSATSATFLPSAVLFSTAATNW